MIIGVSEQLVGVYIDPESKGIANIFVYIYYKDAAKLSVHPEGGRYMEQAVS